MFFFTHGLGDKLCKAEILLVLRNQSTRNVVEMSVFGGINHDSMLRKWSFFRTRDLFAPDWPRPHKLSSFLNLSLQRVKVCRKFSLICYYCLSNQSWRVPSSLNSPSIKSTRKIAALVADVCNLSRFARFSASKLLPKALKNKCSIPKNFISRSGRKIPANDKRI